MQRRLCAAQRSGVLFGGELITWTHPPAFQNHQKSDLFTRGGHSLRVLIKKKKKGKPDDKNKSEIREKKKKKPINHTVSTLLQLDPGGLMENSRPHPSQGQLSRPDEGHFLGFSFNAA